MIVKPVNASRTDEHHLITTAGMVPGILCHFAARSSGGRCLFSVSGRSEELFGISGDPATFFQRFTACVAPEDREAFLISMDNAVRSAGTWEFTGRYLNPLGGEMYFQALAEPVILGNDQIFHGVILDITAYAHAKRALFTHDVGHQRLAPPSRTGHHTQDQHTGNSSGTHAKRVAAEIKRAGSTRIPSETAVQTPEELIHELEVHQIELQMQNDELRKTHLELQESRARYLDLYDFAPMGYITLTDKAIVAEANLAAAALLGAAGKTLKNSRFRKFVVPPDVEAWDRYFVSVLNHDEKFSTSLRLRRNDGSTFAARVESIRLGGIGGATVLVRVAISDISDIREAEKAKFASEMRYRRLFETAQDGILILDADTGQIVDVNPFLVTMLGFSREEFFGKKIWEIGLFRDIVANKDNFGKLQRKEYIRYEDLPLETADGRRIPVEFVSNVYMVDNKKVIQCNIRDVTERKKMSAQIDASLTEKEILLKEIHHRVKNNLQIVSSLLNMHIRKINDPLATEALQDSQNRVMSMALVHEHLYKSNDLTNIDLMNYISALGTGLFVVFETEKHGIRFDLNIHNVYVDINTAIPLGLIINELVTNCLKHAFKGQEDCRISVTATKNPGVMALIVADNGIGIAGDIILEDQNSLGLRLIRALTRQLHGTVVIDRTEGTKFTFAFPLAAEIKTEVLL
jgi:PAS domain S-box-containing protein